MAATALPSLSCRLSPPTASSSSSSARWYRRTTTTLSLSSSDWTPAAAARISSPSNPFVKHCLKLRLNSSYRRSCGAALVVGLTPIMEICRFQELNDRKLSMIDCLLLLDGAEIPKELFDYSTSIVHVSSIVMKKLSGLQSVDSTEAIAVMKIPRSFTDMDSQEDVTYQSWANSPCRLLALDGIQV